VEKFQEWTDPAAKLPEDAVDRDRILTDVSIYWLTATAGSAAHTYYERFNDPAMWAPRERSEVPVAVAVFTTDVTVLPFAAKAHNVVRWSEFGRGGHFAALEAPDDLALDVREFFGTVSRLSGAPGEHGGHELAAAAHAELVERRGQVFLDGVGRDVQFLDDLAGGVPPDDQRDHTGLRAGEPVRAEQQRAELGRGGWLDDDADLRRGPAAQPGRVQGEPRPGPAAQPDHVR
jgi:hypothetical protein